MQGKREALTNLEERESERMRDNKDRGRDREKALMVLIQAEKEIGLRQGLTIYIRETMYCTHIPIHKHYRTLYNFIFFYYKYLHMYLQYCTVPGIA